MHIPVALAAGDPASQTVWAAYCTPPRPGPGPAAIDVTVPGATYNHLYWAWPQAAPLYNYTDSALASGQAVLDYDRLGTGNSTHPPSADLTITSDAYVLHQVIAWARNAGYPAVNVVGHSMGSFIAAQDAGTWPADPTRLVLTGFLDTVTPAILSVSNDVYPAASDPLFAGAGLDPGYLTTLPGTRGSLFYSSIADPAVIAFDEAHKDAVAASEVAQLVPGLTAPPSASITAKVTVPVLIVDGEQDSLFCGAAVNCADPGSVATFEAPFFTAAASLTIRIVPGTGHDLSLHPTAPLSFAIIDSWLRSPAAR